nr:HNH endonuclease signature motif containing protein [Rhodococcus rhodnii]
MFDSGGGGSGNGLVAVAGLVESKRALACAEYRQIRAIGAFHAARVAAEASGSVGIPGESAANEVSLALGMSEGRVWFAITLCEDLENRLPLTNTAFSVGELDLAQVRTIHNLLQNLSDEKARIVEAALFARGPIDGLPPRRLGDRLRRLVARYDRDGFAERSARAKEQRYISVKQCDDGMAFLSGELPSLDAATIWNRLKEMAIGDVCAGDERSMPQRHADALVALADGSGRLTCGCGRNDCATAIPAAGKRGPLVQIVVSDGSIGGAFGSGSFGAGFGASAGAGAGAGASAPGGSSAAIPSVGFLPGVGPLDPETVREAIAHSATQRIHVSAVDPVEPAPGIAALRYRIPRALADRIRARDGVCRFPHCPVPAPSCDIDHTVPFDHENPDQGGRTEEANLACLCRRHHRGKRRAA